MCIRDRSLRLLCVCLPHWSCITCKYQRYDILRCFTPAKQKTGSPLYRRYTSCPAAYGRRLSPVSLSGFRYPVKKPLYSGNPPHGKSDCQWLYSNLQRKFTWIYRHPLSWVWRCHTDGSRCHAGRQDMQPSPVLPCFPRRRKRVFSIRRFDDRSLFWKECCHTPSGSCEKHQTRVWNPASPWGHLRIFPMG